MAVRSLTFPPVIAERVTRVFFALLFGLVLPFICWGSLATPGHPHGRPHLVFWAPVQRVTNSLKPADAALRAVACTPPQPGRHTPAGAAAAHWARTHRGPGLITDLAAGRSVPMMALIALLTLALFGLGISLHNNGRQFSRWLADHLPQMYLSLPEPPPPRIAATS
ncbi:MAG: hypothetical protein H3C34_11330 [Caldilineaceae bacterium]|nr:hypothetical protein [Caldilineaceae bacterium]